jgi:Uma2 family endonuclease
MIEVVSLSDTIKERLESGEEEVRMAGSVEDYFELLDELENTPYLVTYGNDEIIATMGEATEMHELLCGNVIYLFNKNYWGSDTRVYGSNCAVFVEACQKGYDPDVVVVRGVSQLHDRPKRVKPILNPLILVEVLSDSNRGASFTRKINCYKQIPSVQEIVLIDQYESIVNVLKKTAKPNEWLDTTYQNMEGIIQLDSLEISLKDIYRNVLYHP